jgi:hypothetical protein
MALLKNNHTIAATFLTAILAMVVLLSSPSYIAHGEKGFTCAFHFFYLDRLWQIKFPSL